IGEGGHQGNSPLQGIFLLHYNEQMFIIIGDDQGQGLGRASLWPWGMKRVRAFEEEKENASNPDVSM
ncbi:MAG: hypothetical protein WAK96_03640, partial [Desulfobaccales bacterium]